MCGSFFPFSLKLKISLVKISDQLIKKNPGGQIVGFCSPNSYETVSYTFNSTIQIGTILTTSDHKQQWCEERQFFKSKNYYLQSQFLTCTQITKIVWKCMLQNLFRFNVLNCPKLLIVVLANPSQSPGLQQQFLCTNQGPY